MKRAPACVLACVVAVSACRDDTGPVGPELRGAAGPSAVLMAGDGVGQRVTESSALQLNPAISGQRIVWTDFRTDPANPDIYLYDLATRRERALITAPAPQSAPAIDGDVVVWHDQRHGSLDIFAYDLGTETERRITSSANHEQHAAVSGNRIVWQDHRNGNWDIYLYDLSTNTERRITTHASDQLAPDISGDLVVWQDGRNGFVDIYAFDLATNTELRITADSAFNQYAPAIDGGRIAWNDSRHGGWHVYLYDMATGTERRITTEGTHHWNVDISGDWIVWNDDRHGTADIYLHDLSDGTETRLTTDDAYHQYGAAVSGGRVVWEDWRHGNGDVFLHGAIIRPTADAGGAYTGTEGQAIAFSSAGSTDPYGEALTYEWRFGDGGTSTEANPQYAYRDNGTWTARLIVRTAGGLADTATAQVTVGNAAPTAALDAPVSRPEGTGYTITVRAMDAGKTDRASLELWLDCGQGGGYQGPSTGLSAGLTCAAVPDQDTLTVRARVRDKDGGETETTAVVEIRNAAPVATLAARTATTVSAGGSVSFTAAFTDAGAGDGPWTYRVSWGDGTTGTGGTVASQGGAIPLSHAYGTPGTWQAYVRVYDKDGKGGSSTRVTITVNP